MLRTEFEEVFRDQPFHYHFVDDYYLSMYSQETRLAKIVVAMSILAILIASLGVLGLVSYTAAQRTREVGIRKTLGAQTSGILWLFSKEFYILLIIAFIISLPVASLIITKWMASFPYKADHSIAPALLSLGFISAVTLLTIAAGTYSVINLPPTDIMRRGI